MKPVLIILHGALGCKEQFEAWKNVLDEHFDCHLMDFEGHGERSAEEIAYSIKTFSEQVKRYIKDNKLKTPHILGYSMGGYVALYTALYTDGLLGKIMTIATKFDWSPETAQREAGYLKPDLMQSKVPQLAEQLKKNHGEQNWISVVKRTADMMLQLGEKPLVTEENVAGIKNKMKLCVGDKDKMVSVAETVSIYKNNLGAIFCVLPDTGHLPEKMRTERIKFEVEEFLLAE